MDRAAGLALAFALTGLIGGLSACADGRTDGRPNIVLVVADDQDYEHLGFGGNPLAHTPTLDRLAEEGAVFTTAHVPVSRCRPSLASLLSGRWPHQHGIFFNEGPRGDEALDPARSLPRLLRDAGYATFLGGKFWEGDPRAMGFESATVGEGFAREGQGELFAFVREHAGEKPLFVWWSPFLPHQPHDPPRRFVDALDLDAVPTPAWFARPEWSGIDPLEARYAELMALATVAWFDDCVRLLTEELDAAGILADTLFCYLIDNGSSKGLVSKGSPFEKGLRTPILFSWPDRIPAGARRDGLASSLDVYPTLLDYAGVEVPAGIAGHSLRASIERTDEGKTEGTVAPRDVLCGALYPRQASDARPERQAYALYARTRDWKYVLYLRRLDAEANDALRIKHDFAPPLLRRRGDEDLFDLRADPHELDDLADRPEHATVLEDLRARARAWWEESGGKPLRWP